MAVLYTFLPSKWLKLWDREAKLLRKSLNLLITPAGAEIGQKLVILYDSYYESFILKSKVYLLRRRDSQPR